MSDAATPAPVQIRGRVHPLALLLPRTTDIDAIAAHLRGLRGANPEAAPDLLGHSLVCLDLSALEDKDALDLPGLVARLREEGLAVATVRDPSPAQEALLPSLGCGRFQDGGRSPAMETKSEARTEARTETRTETRTEARPERIPPRVIDKPVRCGQTVYARGGDLVVLAGVNPGAEVLADGSIHVYGALRGRALAGALGDVEARVYCGALAAELVGVAGVYMTSDDLAGLTTTGPALCLLQDGELRVLAANQEGRRVD